MNKTRVAALFSTLIGFFLITKIFVPIKLPLFFVDAYILALFFPFIKKSHQIAITLLYQSRLISIFLILIEQVQPTITSMINYRELTIISASNTVNIYSFLINYNFAYFLGYTVFSLSLIIFSVLLEIIYFICLFLQPYSVYYIYKKIGLVERIRNTFPYADPSWWLL